MWVGFCRAVPRTLLQQLHSLGMACTPAASAMLAPPGLGAHGGLLLWAVNGLLDIKSPCVFAEYCLG